MSFLYVPSFHSRLDLNIFISSINNSDMNITGICLFLSKKIINPSFDIIAQSSSWKFFSCISVFISLCTPFGMTTIANKPRNKCQLIIIFYTKIFYFCVKMGNVMRKKIYKVLPLFLLFFSNKIWENLPTTPNAWVMQNADLMQFSATIFTFDIDFFFKQVIFLFYKIGFTDRPEKKK